jgi:hypothetical protein
MSLSNGTLLKRKEKYFDRDRLESHTVTRFVLALIFDKCPIYTHDGVSVKFSTNSHETYYSAVLNTYIFGK